MRRLFSYSLFVACVGMGVVSAALPPAPWDPVFTTPATVASFGDAARPFGIAVGDFDEDGAVDLIVGRVTGHVAFLHGNGDGSFAAAVDFAWKQAYFNAWSFAAADIDGDDRLDLVWGANATSAANDGSGITVDDGEVRAFLGNGDGTFAETTYFINGVRHNAGVLLADVGTDAGSLAAGDLDGDSRPDVVVGGLDGANSVIRILWNEGGGAFTTETLIDQPAGNAVAGAPIYWPAGSTQNSPWGLALADADGDGDLDLWIGDRALYLYLYRNDGIGGLTLVEPSSTVSGRPNALLGHDTYRAAVGYTPSLGAGDVNGDGLADVALGLQSGAQTPASGTAHDGRVLLDVTLAGGYKGLGAIADVGSVARGVTVVDVDGDFYEDLVVAHYEGQVRVLRQLPPLDTDEDGVSDYVDNAPYVANAPRLDMNTDGSLNHLDQLDNDFDTVIGDPEDMSTWDRLGDPVDFDDDNDGVADESDNCPFAANADQADRDGDGRGDACDPLDDRDPDGDGVPLGYVPDDPLFEFARAAKVAWSRGDTRFVIRIDALSRFFQNEFTQILTDAAVLSPEDWALKCWENYAPGDIAGDLLYEPCGFDEGLSSQTLTLDGGREMPITLITIPKQVWTDPPVVAWINDRNDSPLLEIGQHGTYHANNVPLSDWADQQDRNYFSCETCGLTAAENSELLRVGRDTLLGNYDNKWVAESGATAASPRIDWSASAHPLVSYAPPYNASDTLSRQAVAELGYASFSASVYEEASAIFSPEGSHHEQFDDFGLFHASADRQVDPPDVIDDAYSETAFAAYLQSITTVGGLNTWLIEEVEWSGRPCNAVDRLELCEGQSNRENNTVYLPRWQAWMQLLDFVRDYPGGVVLTQGQVALARGLDNCPELPNADQADLDHDGQGDVCDADADGDGRDNATDCAPLDGAAIETPPEVAAVGFGLDATQLVWDSLAAGAGSGTTYDVVRGPIDGLPVTGVGAEICLASGLTGTETGDPAVPPSGAGFWYLVRGSNVCGEGAYGTASDGSPRVSAACGP